MVWHSLSYSDFNMITKWITMKPLQLQRRENWPSTPVDQITTLRDEINRLFDAPFGELFRTGEFFGGWVPSLDLVEDKDNLIAQLELPGLRKQDIDVALHEGVLTISGERTKEPAKDESGTHRTERFFGRFHRTVALPKPVKADAIKATYKDGLLTVVMPKTEEAKPKQIAVTVG